MGFFSHWFRGFHQKFESLAEAWIWQAFVWWSWGVWNSLGLLLLCWEMMQKACRKLGLIKGVDIYLRVGGKFIKFCYFSWRIFLEKKQTHSVLGRSCQLMSLVFLRGGWWKLQIRLTSARRLTTHWLLDGSFRLKKMKVSSKLRSLLHLERLRGFEWANIWGNDQWPVNPPNGKTGFKKRQNFRDVYTRAIVDHRGDFVYT